MVASDDGRQVPVVQAYAFGKYLGYLKVAFDKDGHVVSSTGNPILLDSSIPQGNRPESYKTRVEAKRFAFSLQWLENTDFLIV